jgi:hypothetical protein
VRWRGRLRKNAFALKPHRNSLDELSRQGDKPSDEDVLRVPVTRFGMSERCWQDRQVFISCVYWLFRHVWGA